jgi:hypothetical protein
VGGENSFSVIITLADHHPEASDGPATMNANRILVEADGAVVIEGEHQDRAIFAGNWIDFEVAWLRPQRRRARDIN